MVALKQGSVPDVIANKLDHLLILTSGTEQYLITCTNKKYKFLLTTTLTISAQAVKQSVAYQALQKIAGFYNIDTELKGLSSEERLQKRQEVIRPMVEEFFAWVKQQAAECAVPPKSKTAQGLNFLINQEKYLKVFLEDGDVPIDNSASERAIRTFCIGKKNWMFHNTANGANASALVYSISETAKLNNLRPYYYFKYILTELPKRCDKQGNIDPAELDDLMPWSSELPDECRKPRRS